MIEKWKPIPNFETYEVSTFGRVRCRKNTKGIEQPYYHYIKPWKGNRGYRVSLHKNNKKYDRMVRRLVAEAFIPNPQGYPLVLTVGSDSDDNVNNLMWGNQSIAQKFSRRKRL